jgi:hypothetical protein
MNMSRWPTRTPPPPPLEREITKERVNNSIDQAITEATYRQNRFRRTVQLLAQDSHYDRDIIGLNHAGHSLSCWLLTFPAAAPVSILVAALRHLAW